MADIGGGVAGRVEYVPKVFENHSDENPWWVVIEPAQHSELERIRRTEARAGNGDAISATTSLYRNIICKRVHEVHDLKVTCMDGQVLYPTNGTELHDALQKVQPVVAEAIIEELFDFIKGKSSLQDGLRKNFLSRFATTAPTTGPASGVAPNAEALKEETAPA